MDYIGYLQIQNDQNIKILFRKWNFSPYDFEAKFDDESLDLLKLRCFDLIAMLSLKQLFIWKMENVNDFALYLILFLKNNVLASLKKNSQLSLSEIVFSLINQTQNFDLDSEEDILEKFQSLKEISDDIFLWENMSWLLTLGTRI